MASEGTPRQPRETARRGRGHFRRWWPALLCAALAGVAAATLIQTGRSVRPVQAARTIKEPVMARHMPARERYAYAGPEFGRFVSESRGGWKGGAALFYGWMDAQLPRTEAAGPPPASWAAWMDDKRRALEGIADPVRKAQAQRDVCATVHRRVKLAIPRFSLDRGFEFRHTVAYGERQCFLQSVLIAGLLQRAGLDAGVVMVFRNPEGEYSNNGHAVTLVRFADGRAALVDASEQVPFAKHIGVFAWDSSTGDYRFLAPVYTRGASIIRFTPAKSAKNLPPSAVRPLPVSFVRSQFEYYRGERAPGGLVAKAPNADGLKASARHLRKSVELCPDNPLPRYMLMRAHDLNGDAVARNREAVAARRLYERYGWTPDGLTTGGG